MQKQAITLFIALFLSFGYLSPVMAQQTDQPDCFSAAPVDLIGGGSL